MKGYGVVRKSRRIALRQKLGGLVGGESFFGLASWQMNSSG